MCHNCTEYPNWDFSGKWHKDFRISTEISSSDQRKDHFSPTITSHYPYSSFEEIKWQNFSQSYTANELYRRNIAIRIHIKEALLLGNIYLQEISWSPLFIHFLKKKPSFHNRSCSIFKNESMESFVLSDFLFENIG